MKSLSVLQDKQGLMTTKELANYFGTKPNVITENAKKCLPNKKIENGKPTYWTKEEVTVLIDFMQNNNNRSDLDLSHRMIGISTDLTPALKLKKALDLAQEAYEEELQIIRARAELAEGIVHRIADGKGCFTMNQTAKILKLPYGHKTLFKNLKALGFLNIDNSPRQQYIKDGTFIIVTKYINEHIGNKPVTLVTSSGLVKLAEKLGAEIDFSILSEEGVVNG